MITPSFNITATERVLPKLALDFTTANLDPRITFTRTTSASNPATYVNSSGYITEATNNQPRFDYDPVTLACRGLLIEEQRSNLCDNSNDFAAWTQTRSSVDAGVLDTLSPDGTNNASKLKEDSTASNTHTLKRGIVSLTAATHTVSFYAKAAGRSWIASVNTSLSGTAVNFDLANGTIGTVGANATAYSIQPAGNGWYRCSASWVGISGTNDVTLFLANGNNGLVYTGDGTSGVFLYGFQVELGAFSTSYIPRPSASAATRNADVATMTGTNFSSWYNASAGAFGCSVLPKAAIGTKPVVQCDDTTTLNAIVLQGNATATEIKITTLAVLQNTLSTGTITANAQYGLCGAWSAGSDALSKSGASPSTGSPLTIPTVTQARLGSDGTNYFNGWLKKVNYWPQRVTNSETQAFSK